MRKDLSAALLACALLGACAAFPPAPAPMAIVTAPRLGSGETWSYEQLNPYNGELVRVLTDTLASVDGGFELVERSSRAHDPVVTRYGPGPWQLGLERVDPGGGIAFMPPLALVRFPLAPGSRWQQTVEVRYADGTRHVWTCIAHALDWELVPTPAGSYPALRIVLQRNLGDSNAAWNDTTVYEVLWYAPAVGRWVRHELRTERIEKAHIPRVQRNWIVWELTGHHP